MKECIECKGVSKTFIQGDVTVQALCNIDLKIGCGEFISLSGPSGSGKTTLLNLIGGLDAPTEGEIILDGERVDRMNRSELAAMRLKKLGFVFQAYNLIPVLSARENVEFILELQGIHQDERWKRSTAILEAVGLKGMEDRRPAALSGGQQQRVAVARAIAADPAIILADEPTANLDSATATSLIELMQRLNSEKGITFVFSTHDRMVMKFARRIVTLQDGRLIADEKRN